MSAEQRRSLEAMLREGPLDLGGELDAQRAIFAQMMSAVPLPEDVVTGSSELGGVPVVDVSIAGASTNGVLLYFHGGAYAIGSAASAAGLAADIARRAKVTAVSVDYRLAPEHPYPAAIEDAVAAYRGLLGTGIAPSAIVFAGESAGGGLVMATLVALKAAGLPFPAAAYVVSPWADLSLSGDSLKTKAAADPSLTPEGLGRRQIDYVGSGDPRDAKVSAIFADLAGLPPLLIQVGGNEILLDDATRLAARAAASGVRVTLEVTPDVPHVFVAFAGMLEEADAALDSGARFIRTNLDDHLPDDGPRN